MRWIVAALFLQSSPLWAQATIAAPRPDKIEELRMQNKIRRTDLARINLSQEMPEFHRYLVIQVTGKIGGKDVYRDLVSLHSFSESDMRSSVSTEAVKVGTEVSLESVMDYKGRHFYRVKPKGSDKVTENWIDGLNLIVVGANSMTPGH